MTAAAIVIATVVLMIALDRARAHRRAGSPGRILASRDDLYETLPRHRWPLESIRVALGRARRPQRSSACADPLRELERGRGDPGARIINLASSEEHSP